MIDQFRAARGFQFLIGTLKTLTPGAGPHPERVFQFLIGTLKTQQAFLTGLDFVSFNSS